MPVTSLDNIMDQEAERFRGCLRAPGPQTLAEGHLECDPDSAAHAGGRLSAGRMSPEAAVPACAPGRPGDPALGRFLLVP